MDTVKRLKVPFIGGLENMDMEQLDMALELEGAKGVAGEVNWPGEYPYRPDCCFAVAHSGTHFAVMYHVRGLDLRAVAMEDNGHVWEDSCCEFFVADPCDGTYCNFELNCIGTLLSAKGAGRNGRVQRTPEELSSVRRFTTVTRKVWEENGKIFQWSAGMVIPFSLMGVTPGNIPHLMKANFYKCGDRTAHTHFLSWNPVGCPDPDFHRPEYFGILEF